MKKFSALGLVVALAVTAHAGWADELRANVRLADLDLTHAEGATVLYGRIRSAAKTVCAPFDGRSLFERQSFRSCVSDAVARAVLEVNQPALTNYYQTQIEAYDRDTVASRVW